ncbi:MAG: ISKra4 family transposase, partial [Deltaproteobacteria bacterium]
MQRIRYVWKAARAIFGETSPEAENWVGDRFLALLTGRTGGGVAATIRYWAKRRSKSIDASARKAITKACAYLANRTRVRLMHYADYLADGLPISTGVIEGACRYLVKDRMD